MSTKTKKKKKSAKKNVKPLLLRIVAVSCALLVVAGIVSLIATHEKHEKANLLSLDKDVAYGIDVSAHNGKIDWKAVKDEVDFAFIRVGARGYTDGNIALDKKAKYNLKNAAKYGVPVGVYIYSQAINEEEAEEEAAFVLQHIKGYDVSLPVVIDFEYAYKNGEKVGRLAEAKMTNSSRTKLLNAFCAKVKKGGYTPGIYASSYIYKYYLNMRKLDENAVIWVADYNEKVTYGGDYDIWQYSNRGTCDGVTSKYVDTNYWYIKEKENE